MNWNDYRKETRHDFEEAIYNDAHEDMDLADSIMEEIQNSEDDFNTLLSPSLTSNQLGCIIDNYADTDDIERGFNDYIWEVNYGVRDSVTGNLSGSYAGASKAKNNVKDLVWDDDFRYVLAETGMTLEKAFDNPEHTDVLARIYALDEQYWELVEDFNRRAIERLVEKINEMRHDKKLKPVKLERN